MKPLNIIMTSLLLVGIIFAGGNVIHSHAESTVTDVVATSKQYHLMNSAEIQLLKVDMDLQTLTIVPEHKQDEWSKEQKVYLIEQKTYWTNRVRELEKNQQENN